MSPQSGQTARPAPAWVRCPLSTAMKIADMGCLMVGWVRAKGLLLSNRPLQCHRCLEFKHTRQQCSGPDRSDTCYRCGGQDHVAARCTGIPSCILCKSCGRPSEHRMGGLACRASKSRN
ncbi:uncharacterized protein [Anoplolepis gracilipes]|uniref:uncharacterized protein n=1 Tax=Anoplolepis gracilipes TaxID=354296 RepID=UPI003BA00A99